MSSESWQALGNIVNSTGIAGFAITGAASVLAGYQAYASPYTSLAESKRKLEEIKSRFQELSPQRREEIDSQCRASNSKTLKDLEGDLEMLINAYHRLNKGCDGMTLVERHIPYSKFRQHVRKLERDTRGLSNDIMTTTVPHLDDMGFDPQNPGLAMDRSSSSESSIGFPNHPVSSTVVDIIPMTRV